MRRSLFVSTVLTVLFIVFQASAAQITLSQYLKEVESKHLGLKANQLTQESADLKSSEADLLYSPQFFAQSQFLNDSKPGSPVPYTEITNQSNSFGFQKQFSTGTQTKLAYNLSYTELQGVKVPSFYEGKPVLEINQPLWRNTFGSETRNTENQIKTGNAIKKLGDRFSRKMSLLEAEMSYWRLALARQAVNTSKDAYERGQKLYEWNVKRARLQLADKADLLQAESALQLRKLQLQSSLDEERSASRLFNKARGLDQPIVSESLETLTESLSNKSEPATPSTLREDAAIALTTQKMAEISVQSAQEKARPNLDLFGSVALNSNRTKLSDSLSDSFGTKQPTYVVGVKLVAPLDFFALSDIKKGADRDLQAAELQFQRKVFENREEWLGLLEDLKETRARLELSQSIERAQLNKLNYERERLNRGRATTYQLLLAEEDLAQAQLNLRRAQAQVLQVFAQIKTFNGEKTE